MKKDEIPKIQNAITFKKRPKQPQKSLVLNIRDQDKDWHPEQFAYKNRIAPMLVEDGKSDTNKSSKTEKKSLPTLGPPSSNPIRKLVTQKALFDLVKNSTGSSAGTFQDKETLQQETIQLKQRNNELSVENMKLKTKVLTLEGDNLRMIKLQENDAQIKYPGNKESRLKSNQQTISSLKGMLMEVKKELSTTQDQNLKIKKTVKYTRVSELQQQRRSLQEQAARLRELLEEQVSQNLDFKLISYNKSQLQQQCSTLQHANTSLKKEMVEYTKKMKGLEDRLKSIRVEPEKNLNRVVLDLRRVIKEKNAEIDSLKRQKEQGPKQERVGVRNTSAPKSKHSRGKCESCPQHQQENRKLTEIVVELEEKLRLIKTDSPSFQDIVLRQPTPAELETVSQFLTFRFKAHHLNIESVEKHLIRGDSETVSVGNMVENLLAEPFFLVHPPYLQCLIAYLFYSDSGLPDVKVNESYQQGASKVKSAFLALIKPYTLMETRMEQQIFIQIAQIVTNYCDHISAAFDSKRNGQGTLTKEALCQFLRHIELQEQYIEFIITQIVLESSDMEHLNYYSLFQIFYLPANIDKSNQPPEPVKELDEEYEESQQSGGDIQIGNPHQLEVDNFQIDAQYENDFELLDQAQKLEEDFQADIPVDESV